MQSKWIAGLGLILGLSLWGAATAQAQNVTLDAPGILLKKKPPGPPDVPPAPLAWPRLDPGAVLCRTEVDLDRLATIRAGGNAGPADCRHIFQPTAIEVLHRAGPGRTEVQITGHPDQTGWTDAWLPSKAPPGATPAATGAR